MTIFSWEGFQFPQHHANYRIGNLKCISGRTCKTSVIKKITMNNLFMMDGILSRYRAVCQHQQLSTKSYGMMQELSKFDRLSILYTLRNCSYDASLHVPSRCK
ncbi:hypothetical protein EUGRSUZ_D01217 [Eucalyptus grandis]|uniref:Uncharacterized protein n=2 Tax=Eucalyptus grandis TaxID=71139 RepID=A0ACC3L5S3_EUCGR|nr:hypothetical protein EUGRSUZ_D01217 [Eucalyptus grandis]